LVDPKCTGAGPDTAGCSAVEDELVGEDRDEIVPVPATMSPLPPHGPRVQRKEQHADRAGRQAQCATVPGRWQPSAAGGSNAAGGTEGEDDSEVRACAEHVAGPRRWAGLRAWRARHA